MYKLTATALCASVLLTVPAWAEEATDDAEGADAEVDPIEVRLKALEDRIRALEAELAAAKAEPAPEPEPEPEISAEELAAIEAALADELGGDTSPPPPPPRRPAGFQSMNPDISFIADVALAWFSADEPLQAGAHDPRVNGFNLQQLEMSIGKAVDPFFRLDGNIVFSQFGVEIEEIYATTLGLPLNLQVRVGQFLTRFGRQNPTHPHSWWFADQPFALGRAFGGEGNRGLGVEASVLMPFPWYFELLGSATMANGAATALSFFGGNDLGLKTPLDMQGTVAIKQFFPLHDDVSLMWGVSYAAGANPTGRNNRTDLFGTDLFFKVRPISKVANPPEWSVHSELIHRRRQVPGTVQHDTSLWVQSQWRFSFNFAFAARYEFGTPTFDLERDIVVDDTNPGWAGRRHRVALSGTVWPTEFSRFRLQGGVDLPDWRDEPDFFVMLAAEFSMGAHGAHAF